MYQLTLSSCGRSGIRIIDFLIIRIENVNRGGKVGLWDRFFGKQEKVETDCQNQIVSGQSKHNNDTTLREINLYLQEKLPSIADEYLWNNYGVDYVESSHKVNEYIASFNEKTSAWEYLRLVDVVDIISIKRNMELGMVKISEWPIEIYKHYLTTKILSIHNDNDLFACIPDENECNSYKNNIQFSIRQYATAFHYSLSDLADLQRQLINLKPSIEVVLRESDDVDWGGVARNFGGGALAVAVPIIGIPMLVANYFGTRKKEQQQEEQWKHYCDVLNQYITKWDETNIKFNEMYAITNDYYVKKATTMTGNAFNKAFSMLDSKGYKLFEKNVYFE